MPSSHKTQRLKLNRFVGSDKPKMDDFNYDNAQLEQLLGAHLEDRSIHITQAEHTTLRQPYHMFVYTGDGRASRTFSLPFTPTFGVVFAMEWMPQLNNGPNPSVAVAMSGFFSKHGSSKFLRVDGTSLTITHQASLPAQSMASNLNLSDVKYAVVSFR